MFTQNRHFVSGFNKGLSYISKHPTCLVVWSVVVYSSLIYTLVRVVKLIAHLV